MSPVTHFLNSWIVGNGSPGLASRGRAIITIAGIAPDLDGLGIIPELLTRGSEHPLLWYSQYHHLHLWPYSDSWQWTRSGQWELNARPNFVVTLLSLVVVFWLAWKRGYSPLEMISAPADKALVETLRRRFPARV